MVSEVRDARHARKRVPADAQRAEHDPKGPKVNRRIASAAPQLLGRHVRQSADVRRRGLAVRRARGTEARAAEVAEQHVQGPVRVPDQDVLQLEVAVDDASRVQETQRVKDLGRGAPRDRFGRRAVSYDVQQRAAFGLLHHDVVRGGREDDLVALHYL